MSTPKKRYSVRKVLELLENDDESCSDLEIASDLSCEEGHSADCQTGEREGLNFQEGGVADRRDACHRDSQLLDDADFDTVSIINLQI